MNLKTKLMVHAKIEEDVADHIVKGLPLSQQKQLCLLTPDNLIKEIPELMREANCLDEFEMDPDFQEPNSPAIDDLLGSNQVLMPKPSITTPAPKQNKEINWRYLSYLLILSCCFLTYKLSLANQESTEKQLQDALKELALSKKEPPPIIPTVPARGSWMFTPDGDFNSKVIPFEQDSIQLRGDYTIELWLKKPAHNTQEINLIEMHLNNETIERLFLNEDSQFCFSAGPDSPILKHPTAIPDNGHHYHLLISKLKDTFHLFINGKLKKTMKLKTSYLKQRDSLQILRSNKPYSGLGIDEVRISKGALFTKNFTPHRTLYLSASTILYMPLEKAPENKLRFYGVNHYSESDEIEGGKWLNIIHETQKISNHLESLRKAKKN